MEIQTERNQKLGAEVSTIQGQDSQIKQLRQMSNVKYTRVINCK